MPIGKRAEELLFDRTYSTEYPGRTYDSTQKLCRILTSFFFGGGRGRQSEVFALL